jgi:hypothetical protein
MENFQKGSVAVWVIVVLVLIMGIGVYIYKDKSNPQVSSGANTELKTYSNDAFGYSIKYPSGYTLDEVNNSVIESSTRDIAEIKSDKVKIGIIANKNRNSIGDECRDVSTYAQTKKLGDNTFNVIFNETARTDMGNPDSVHRDYYLKTQSSCYLLAATYPPSLPQAIKDQYNAQIENIIGSFSLK